MTARIRGRSFATGRIGRLTDGNLYELRQSDGRYRPFLLADGDDVELDLCEEMMGATPCQLPAGHVPSRHNGSPEPLTKPDDRDWALHAEVTGTAVPPC